MKYGGTTLGGLAWATKTRNRLRPYLGALIVSAGLLCRLTIAASMPPARQAAPIAAAQLGFGVDDLMGPLENFLTSLIGKFMTEAEKICQKWLTPLDSTVAKYEMTMDQLKHWGPFGATQSAMTVFDQFRSVSVPDNVGTVYSIGGIPRDNGGTSYQGTGSVQPWGWTPQAITVPVWTPGKNPWSGSGGGSTPSPGASPTPTPSPGASPTPTPTPTPSVGGSVTVQAEAPGNTYVNCVSESPASHGYATSDCVGQFVRPLPQSSWSIGFLCPNLTLNEYMMVIHYSEWGPTVHWCMIEFDGVLLQNDYLSPTGGENIWGTSSAITVFVTPSPYLGSNYPTSTHFLKLVFDTSNGLDAWIDSVEFIPVDPSAPASVAARHLSAVVGHSASAGSVSTVASVSGVRMVAARPDYHGLSNHFLGFDRQASGPNYGINRAGSNVARAYGAGWSGPGATITSGSASGMLKVDFSPYDPSTGQGTFLGSVRALARMVLGGLVWCALLFWIVRTLTVKFAS